ncbi:hypothetical protein SRABI83_04592 [Arthrobacter sp. Bi83]|uniref:hypothetical protein n=1 Tax=Arthrobacter sp. Bi83 TaxID=2822353 RepID=UPI001D26C8B5|nr:hypothetical protein [Arthrobacter sp. Bi83]CAH0303400.1 hypothetical protein SRABI83_04592 [Arthrobacter sp. Bi83]
MTATHFDRFVAEALTADRETDSGLTPDELYGLYTSWSLINTIQPESPEALRAGLKELGIDPDHNELSMTGPAAADYILASAPSLI